MENKLDVPKILNECTWVGISYEDDWYPGEIIKVIDENNITVKLMDRAKKGGFTFVWTRTDDICNIDKYIYYFFSFLYCTIARIKTLVDF